LNAICAQPPGRPCSWDETRANDTHESKTDSDVKLFRKGKAHPAKLCFMGRALIENRHGLVVQALEPACSKIVILIEVG
jgi:hypothetical protein